MFKQRKIKSLKKVSRNHHSKISIKSNNLSSSISNVNSTACSTRKSKCMFSAISSATSNKNDKPSMIVKHTEFNTKAQPKNAAVHFGNFYGLWDDVEKVYCNRWNNHLIGEETVVRPRRLEFTRQMVHKLERATDTEDYMRQVAVLLKKTIEPPNFRLSQLLTKNSIPNGSRGCSDYPLWYKEPQEVSLVFSDPIARLKA